MRVMRVNGRRPWTVVLGACLFAVLLVPSAQAQSAWVPGIFYSVGTAVTYEAQS